MFDIIKVNATFELTKKKFYFFDEILFADIHIYF